MIFKSPAHKLRRDLKISCSLGSPLFELEASLGVMGLEVTSSEQATLGGSAVLLANLQVGPFLPSGSHVIMCLYVSLHTTDGNLASD